MVPKDSVYQHGSRFVGAFLPTNICFLAPESIAMMTHGGCPKVMGGPSQGSEVVLRTVVIAIAHLCMG